MHEWTNEFPVSSSLDSFFLPHTPLRVSHLEGQDPSQCLEPGSLCSDPGILLPATRPQLLHLYSGHKKRASFIEQLGQDQVTACGQATLLSMMTGQLLLGPLVPSTTGPGEGVAHGLGPRHLGWAGRRRGPSWAGHKATKPVSASLSVRLIKGRRPPWPRPGPLPSYLPWGRQGPS